MDNVKAVLEAAGSSLERAVKPNIYLADIAEFAAVNQAYAEYFTSDPPARATVQVAQLPLVSARRDRHDRARVSAPSERLLDHDRLLAVGADAHEPDRAARELLDRST